MLSLLPCVWADTSKDAAMTARQFDPELVEHLAAMIAKQFGVCSGADETAISFLTAAARWREQQTDRTDKQACYDAAFAAWRICAVEPPYQPALEQAVDAAITAHDRWREEHGEASADEPVENKFAALLVATDPNTKPEVVAALQQLEAKAQLYRTRWLSCVTQEEAARLRAEIDRLRALSNQPPSYVAGLEKALRLMPVLPIKASHRYIEQGELQAWANGIEDYIKALEFHRDSILSKPRDEQGETK
jgi:hypothetical protein